MRKKIFLILAVLTITFTRSPIKSENDWVNEKLNSMTLKEKIAQMIVTYSNGYTADSKEEKRLKNLVQNLKVGGIIFFKGISHEEAKLINKLQGLSETPLLISQDFERGTGMRLTDGSLFPNNMALGATRDPELAYKMGLLIAKECRAIGVHQNYAPVMDVNNNPNNPIINVRSFGEDPNLVSEMGIKMIKGLQDGGVIATAKHFPGHGDTDIDSHSDLPIINHSRERLEKVELLPFKNAIESGVKSVMIAHLSIPTLENRANLPSSLSDKIVNDLLINKLGFQGLIVTDALNMAGVTKYYSTKEIAVLCVSAGIDLILMPKDEETAINAIYNAVQSGKIQEEQINISVRKILEAKKWLGLEENKFTDVSKLNLYINSEEEKNLSQGIADKSITLVKNENNIIPITNNYKDKKCLVVSLNNGKERENSDFFFEEFFYYRTEHFKDFYILDLVGDLESVEYIVNRSADYDIILIPIYAKVKIKTGTVGIPQTQIDLINQLVSKNKTVVVISFGNPYLLKGFEGINSYICAYGDSETSVSAALKAVFGKINISGKLPVTISENYPFGTGITINK